MLKDAIDHVNYEEETEEYLRKLVGSAKDPVVLQFTKEVLADFDLDEEDFEEGVDLEEMEE